MVASRIGGTRSDIEREQKINVPRQTCLCLQLFPYRLLEQCPCFIGVQVSLRILVAVQRDFYMNLSVEQEEKIWM